MAPGSLDTRPTVTALSPPAPPQFSPRCESSVDTPSEPKRTMWKPSDHTRGFFRFSAPGWVGLYDMAVSVRRIFEWLRNHADVMATRSIQLRRRADQRSEGKALHPAPT